MMARFPPAPLLRDIRELDDDVQADTARRVATARVVFAEHEVLQHDFPSLAGQTRQVREAWLLEQAGIISTTQAAQTVTNTRIRVTGPVRQIWRPPGYGRACVVPGLVDVKGMGVAVGEVPSLQHHSSGLCTLGEVLREVLLQSLIDELFARAAPWFWTLPVYGVIDPGFDVRTRDGSRLPAGILVRRAHQRPAGGIQLPWKSTLHERTQLSVELLLRHYGITSANRGTRFRFERGAGGIAPFYAGDAVTDLSDRERRKVAANLRGRPLPLECDGINIQMTRTISARGRVRAQLLDFDNYEVRAAFHDPVISLVCNEPLRWGIAIWPHEREFVQPLPSLRVSAAKWGFADLADGPRPRRSQGEGPYLFAHDLAAQFRSGELMGEQVRRRMRRFVTDSIGHW
jgi:hypothetical protein